MQDVRIYFIGDSYVNGTGDPQFLGWPGRVCAASLGPKTHITGYNLGIRGDTSADVLRRWRAEVDARRLLPHDARLVFGFGANDCWLIDGEPRVDEADTVKNARHILSEARALLPTLLVGPPPGKDDEEQARRSRVSHILAGIAAQEQVPYLDVIGQLDDTQAWRREAAAGDGVHPGAQGYASLARAVLAWSAWWFKAS